MWSAIFFVCVKLTRTFSENLAFQVFVVTPPIPFPANHVAFQVFFVPTPSENVLAFQGLFCTSRNKSFPANHVAFQVCFCVNLHTPTLLKKPCRFSSFFLSTCAPLTLPENHVSFHCFLVARPAPPEPSQHTICRFKFLLCPSPSGT